MRLVDAIILAVVVGEFVEIEFWRKNTVGYKTYDATAKNVNRLLGVLANTKIYHTDTHFHRKDMTIHFEV